MSGLIATDVPDTSARRIGHIAGGKARHRSDRGRLW